MGVRIENLRVRYGEREIIRGLTASVGDGTIAAVRGASGSGKTTLLRAVLGLVSYDGKITKGGATAAVSFQTPRLLPWRTAAENVADVLKPSLGKGSIAEAEKYLSLVGLRDCSGALPSELSGGMAARVSLARAFAYADNIKGPVLLVLDEPTRELDARTAALISDIIVSYRGRATVLCATHDDSLSDICDSVITL